MIQNTNRLLVSDVIYPEAPWNTNIGVTLPEGENATHNIALSPLFFGRSGNSRTNDYDKTSMYRGYSIYIWSANSKTSANAMFILPSATHVAPSTMNMRTFANSLRCLVSTNNRIIDKDKKESLVSDVIFTGDNMRVTNWGVTLPSGENATHSISLSPLFVAPMGISGHTDTKLSNTARGSEAKLWSSTSSNMKSSWPYFLSATIFTVWPSDLYFRSYTISSAA